jgi:hypothetical protein
VVSHDLLVISRYVKSVACVNKKLHYHDQAEITGDMLETMYPAPWKRSVLWNWWPTACPTGCWRTMRRIPDD